MPRRLQVRELNEKEREIIQQIARSRTELAPIQWRKT